MNFRRWVVFSFLIHALVVIVDKGGGLVLYLLTADHADQHGAAGIVASLPFVLQALANLGLATSLVFFIRRGRFTPQQCFETTMTTSLVWGTFVAGLVAAVTLLVLPSFGPDWTFSPAIVLPLCAAVPVLLVSSYANSVQLATDRVREYGAVNLATSVLFLPAFFAFFFWAGGDSGHGDVPFGVAWGRLVSSALVALLALLLVRRIVRLRFGVHREFLREGIRYGWKANLTSTLNYLNHRVDLLVLGALYIAPGLDGDAAKEARLAQVGFYSMSVTWAELVWGFPDAMRDLFFSKIAGSSHEEARELTPVLSRLGLALALVGGVLVLTLVDPLMGGITWLARGSTDVWYAFPQTANGETWSGTVGKCLLILTPGTVAYTVSKVLQADLAARDRQRPCVHAQLLVLVVMLVLDVLWMPEHGAVGAAAASTVAYFVSTVYTAIAYSRETGIPLRRCLLVQPSDFRRVGEIVSAVWNKIRGRSAA